MTQLSDPYLTQCMPSCDEVQAARECLEQRADENHIIDRPPIIPLRMIAFEDL